MVSPGAVGRPTRAVTDPRERAALKLLRDAGWSVSDLAGAFSADERAIRRAIDGRMTTVDPRQCYVPTPGELEMMRKRTGLSLKEAGARVGVSESTICKMERGDHNYHHRLCDLLDVYESEVVVGE